MNLHKWLAALFVLLVLGECAQVATEQQQAPVPCYQHDNGPDRPAIRCSPGGGIGPRGDRYIPAVGRDWVADRANQVYRSTADANAAIAPQIAAQNPSDRSKITIRDVPG